MLTSRFLSKAKISNLSSNRSSIYEIEENNTIYQEWIDNLKILGNISIPDLEYEFLNRFPNITFLVNTSILSQSFKPQTSDISKLYQYVNSLRRTNIALLWKLQFGGDVDVLLLKIKNLVKKILRWIHRKKSFESLPSIKN